MTAAETLHPDEQLTTEDTVCPTHGDRLMLFGDHWMCLWCPYSRPVGAHVSAQLVTAKVSETQPPLRSL